MRVLNFLMKCIAYFVGWFILSAIFTLIIPELTINKSPNQRFFLVAQQSDNEIILTSLQRYDSSKIWFDKDESRDFPEYGGIYIKVLEKKGNSEKLELTHITDDSEKIYRYKIENGKVFVESYYYRGIGIMGISMAVSFFVLLIFYFLYPVIRKRLTFNRIVR